MFFEYDAEIGETAVITEIEDACAFCKNYDDCPLINALEINFVYPSASNLTVERCAFYELEESYSEN